jgi:hypothetical protein
LQAPPVQVPGVPNVRNTVAEMHAVVGGAVHALGVPTHAPLAQLSPVVHALPSSHDAPFAYA